MKFKITKPNEERGWWYNDHVGEEFEVNDFAYYKDGANHPLVILNYHQIEECIEKYGNVHMHTCRDPHGNYYGPIYGGGPFWQIHLENTNYEELKNGEQIEI